MPPSNRLSEQEVVKDISDLWFSLIAPIPGINSMLLNTLGSINTKEPLNYAPLNILKESILLYLCLNGHEFVKFQLSWIFLLINLGWSIKVL